MYFSTFHCLEWTLPSRIHVIIKKKKNQLRGAMMQVIFKLTHRIHYLLFSAPVAEVLSPA